MNTIQVDSLNTFLIIISFLIAYSFPFEFFIIIYALLGPLHYLTEINWIKDKKYFTNSSKWAIAMVVFSVIVTLPFIFSLDALKQLVSPEWLQFFQQNSITLLPVAFLVAFLLLSPFSKTIKLLLFFVGCAIAILVSVLPTYQIIIGVFLPTVIHVYFFTLLFMWYGAIKSGSKIGWVNIVLLILLPLFLFIIPVDGPSYNNPTALKSLFLESKFHALNATISKVLGITDGKQFSFFEDVYVKIQIFITFAYTYHYLNWFSKTTVIGWHKNITTKKSVIILALWAFSLMLYLYNYKAGVAVVLFLSMLHVFMEFPLNVITIKAIFNVSAKRKEKVI